MKFIDDFRENSVAGLISINFNEKTKRSIALEDWESFGTELLEASLENLKILVILAVAAIIENFGFMEAFFNIGFGNIENDGGFDFMTGAGGDGHDLIFFAGPAANRGEY